MSTHLNGSSARISFGIRQWALCLLLLLFTGLAAADGTFSGSWYNPDRDGEGFHIEMLPDDQALIVWFTFPGITDNGQTEQAWILGTGSVSGDTITILNAFKARGPEFGDDYDVTDWVSETWGNITISFSDPDNGQIDYDGNDGSGMTLITRVTQLADQKNATRLPVGMSGAWYDPGTNGQGWFVEVLSDKNALVYWFTYDENGNQSWNLGVGYFDGNRIVVPNSSTGKGTRFGDSFEKDDVIRERFTSIVFEYVDCHAGMVHYETADGAESASLPLERITELSGHECKVLIVQPTEGGSINSATGKSDCRESKTCLIDASTGSQWTDTFTPIPRSGYIFTGWENNEHSECGGSLEPCSVSAIDMSENDFDMVLTAGFKPEGSVYFPPADSLNVCSYVDPVGTWETECEIKKFEDYGYGKLEDYIVNNDTLFVDTRTRNKELDLLSEEERNTACQERRPFGLDYATYTPTPPDDINDDVTLDEMAVPLFFARVHHEYLGDPDAPGLIYRSLLAYAEAGVWLNIDLTTWGENRQYNLSLNMMIYLLAWNSIRYEDFVTVEKREFIDKYFFDLNEIISDSPGKPSGCTKLSYCAEIFNHSWTRDLASATYGVVTDNDSLFQLAIAGYFAVLDGLVRPDGSFSHESVRGGSATSYSVLAASMMMRIAELAAVQGYNLYDVEVDGISLHKIVEFLIRVHEDESVIHQYAHQEGDDYCSPEVCSLWNDQSYLYNFDRGWPEFEVYRRRFPESPLVSRYLAMYPDEDHPALWEGPFLQTCEFRKTVN